MALNGWDTIGYHSTFYSVLSTSGVEPPSSNLMPDKKGKGLALQSVMWNLLRKYPMYQDCVIMILKAFLFT